jgi:uncharacterized membrane protein
MVDFVRLHLYDVLGLVLSLAAVVCYQVYLRVRDRRSPAASALYGMNAARVAWVEGVMREGKDILAVQTLRNSTMASSFMASTAILLIIGVLTLSAQGDRMSGTWHALNVLGKHSADIWLFKLLIMLFDLLVAFFAFCLSIRLYHHIGYQINTPADLRREVTQPAHVGAELNRAAIFYLYRLGMRAYSYTVPLLFWLFGPLWLMLATALMVYFLSHLDRAPRSDADLMG